MNKDTWKKYEYVCSYCDSLCTYVTTKDIKDIICYMCSDGYLTLMSVADATIHPTKKEETMDITTEYNPNLLVTYKKIEDGEVSYVTDKVVDIEYSLDQSRRDRKWLTTRQDAWFLKESKLRTLLEEVYADSEDQDSLSQIAEIFDVPLTKEVSYTATITIHGTVDVDLTVEYDLEEIVSEQIGNEISYLDYFISDVEEN